MDSKLLKIVKICMKIASRRRLEASRDVLWRLVASRCVSSRRLEKSCGVSRRLEAFFGVPDRPGAARSKRWEGPGIAKLVPGQNL